MYNLFKVQQIGKEYWRNVNCNILYDTKKLCQKKNVKVSKYKSVPEQILNLLK